jgi:hypothetical protein
MKYVGYVVLTSAVMKDSAFWDITPYRRWKSADVSEEHRIHLQGRSVRKKINMPTASCILVSMLSYASTLKTDAICSSETSSEFHRATRRCVPEDRKLFKIGSYH